MRKAEGSNECVKMALKMEKDDVKDAEMLTRYAERAAMLGDEEAARIFRSRAERRIGSDYEESRKLVKYEMDRMAKEGETETPGSAPQICWQAMREMQNAQVGDIKARIAAVKSV